MRNYLVVGYLVIAVICSIYFKACSSTAHESYGYNVGKALFWPVSVLNR